MRNILTIRKKYALYAMVLSGFLLQPSLANTGGVTLKSSDGSMNITGEYIELKDEHYILRTSMGLLSFAVDSVECEGADCPSFSTTQSDLHFIGSDTVGLGVMPLLLDGYSAHLKAELQVSNTRVSDEILAKFVGDNGYGDEIGSFLVTSTTSGRGFVDLLNEGSAISMASRRIKPKEARALRDAGYGNMVSLEQEHIIAVDSLIVIVNPENNIDSVSITDLMEIYSGTITNWEQLGGTDLPIQVITRNEGSGTLSVFQKRTFGKDVPPTPQSAIVAYDNPEVATQVNDLPGAIGFVGYAFQRGAKALNLVNECGISVAPDSFSAKTEEYAMGRRLYLYNKENPDEKAREFIDFAMSKAADGVISKSGFISLAIAKRIQAMDSNRAIALLNVKVDAFEENVVREMLDLMAETDRLSSTFRFHSGSSRLDELGLLQLKRLANYLEKLPQGSNVTMVGFTDDVGVFGANRNLSIARAQQVVDLLLATANPQISHINLTVDGFGEVSPSGCNSSVNGRGINRRVEVWISK